MTDNTSPGTAPGDGGTWTTCNRACYRLATWLQQRRVRPLPETGTTVGRGRDDILYVAWGRIGDAILGAPALALLRARTGRRVVAVGRPECAPILAPHADAFVALPAADDGATNRAFAATTAGPWFAAVTDLHAFHGGIPRLGAWFAGLSARHRLSYDGYAPRHLVAPVRRWPVSVDVVSPCAKADDVAHRHVLLDTRHYLQAVLGRLGAANDVDLQALAPRLHSAGAVASSAAIACQPFSNNRKKDWPTARWRALFATLPEARFVLLGSDRDRSRAAELAAPNVDDRCGTTDLAAALHAIAGARAFVGVDSGLAHAAAALRRPTLVVSHGSNLGYFFPYPDDLGFDHVRVVHDARFAACAGCLAACRREPLWRTYRRGALCLRELAVEPVRAALLDLLATTGQKTVATAPA